MEEVERQRYVCTMKKDGTGNWRVVKNSLVCVTADATWDHGESWSVLPQRAMSESVTHQRPGGHSWSELLLEAILKSEDAELVLLFTWESLRS